MMFRADQTPSHRASTLSPSWVAMGLGLVAAMLVVIGVATQMWLYLGHPGKSAEVLIGRFDLNGEGNIPAWFSAMLLFLTGLTLLCIGRQDGTSWRGHWMALGTIFILLSLDENASLHERTIKPLRDQLQTSGIFYFAWLIPALIFVAGVLIFCLPFLLKLPRKTAILFVVAGAIYLSGAVGMEMISGVWVEKHDETNLTSAILSAVEETLELAGTILFLYANLDYAARRHGGLRVTLSHS